MTARDLDTATDQLRPASYVRWVTDDMRADATAYMARHDHADLLPMLGLADEPEPTQVTRHCPGCHRQIRSDRLVCRRTPACDPGAEA